MNSFKGIKFLLPKIFRMFVGFIILSIGLVTVYQANIGLGAWEVLHDGIDKQISFITYGQASIIVGLLVLSIGVMAKEKIGIATILNILVLGNVVDLVMYLNIIPKAPNFFVGILMGFIGAAIITFGIYFYISAGLGAGPRDTFLVFATKKTGKPVGLCRSVIELTVVFLGFLLGGRVGVGTVMIALISGPLMQIIFGLVKFDIKSVKHIGLGEFFDILFNKKEVS